MADILGFDPSKRKNRKKSVPTEPVTDDTKRIPAFFDNNIDPEYVEAVIDSENIMLAFATVLLMLRQISTDGDLTIDIDENGVHFNSVNSVNTEAPENGMQANTSMNKQAYMFLTDMATGKDIPPQEIANTLALVMRSMIMYEDSFEIIEYDDEEGDGVEDDDPSN